MLFLHIQWPLSRGKKHGRKLAPYSRYLAGTKIPSALLVYCVLLSMAWMNWVYSTASAVLKPRPTKKERTIWNVVRWPWYWYQNDQNRILYNLYLPFFYDNPSLTPMKRVHNTKVLLSPFSFMAATILTRSPRMARYFLLKNKNIDLHNLTQLTNVLLKSKVL